MEEVLGKEERKWYPYGLLNWFKGVTTGYILPMIIQMTPSVSTQEDMPHDPSIWRLQRKK